MRTYKYTSTKEYVDAFPCAYRQWRADNKSDGMPGCNKIHGYSFSMKFYFGCDELDHRKWAIDYGSLRPLKSFLESQFDHCLLVAQDDPNLSDFKHLDTLGLAKVVVLPNLGCEALADQLYKYVNGIFVPMYFGTGESDRIWCYRVEVRETQSNMAFREGHREDNEDLFA